MSDFFRAIVEDLRSFAADLLDPGLQQKAVGRRWASTGALGVLMGAVDELASLLLRLLAEVDLVDVPHAEDQVYTATPRGAAFSRRPADWTSSANAVLPLRFVRIAPAARKNPQALAWLQHLLELQDDNLESAERRYSKHVEGALEARRGRSAFASADVEMLHSILHQLAAGRMCLRRAMLDIQRDGGFAGRSSQARPVPFPRSPAWALLRARAAAWTDPQSNLSRLVTLSLVGAGALADGPYLYQRWCGLKLVEGLEELGWRPATDPTGPLLLGGSVLFQHPSGITLTLWVEARVSADGSHPSGFLCRSGPEVMPDYLLVTPGQKGPDAFVLDPTLSSDEDVCRGKSRYLKLLDRPNPAMIAGVPVIASAVRRAWAAAPILSRHCKIFDHDGHSGIVPMHPLEWRPAPLLSWLRDVTDHAIAWGRFNAAGV